MSYDSSLLSLIVGIIILLVVWEAIWKGLALWKSARHDQRGWFIALFVLNTAGILPIIYILFFQKTKHPN